MPLTKKQISALAAAFTMAVGGSWAVFNGSHNEKNDNSGAEITAQNKSGDYKGSPAPVPATVLSVTGDGVFQVSAHIWVSQYISTTICINGVQYGADGKPLCNEQAEISGTEKPSAGKNISIFNIKSLGSNIANENFQLPQKRPRQDVVKGPVAAQVTHMVDGDTLQVTANIWPGQYIVTDIRVGGIDTPEKDGKAKCAEEAALAEKSSAEAKRLVSGKQVLLYNIKFEKYGGRVLADVKTIEGRDLGSMLVSKGLAKHYGGKTKESWCAIR